MIQNETKEVINKGLVLAPLSVLPTHQGKGIGSKLIKALEEKVANQYSFISILGSPSYYSRFGYEEAAHFGIKAPFEVPSEYFLIKEMTKEQLASSRGTLIYSAAFS
ncbi:N-acetyltransferase [Vagococcus fluvialis]|uniref:GNAT family N-acetyltransferase n=1 Tax=Vagococcus fluvialis TaxID=2738 RepID=UPI00242D9FA7|nr:N-acetyltransferase [Vagococcus fluvialis]